MSKRREFSRKQKAQIVARATDPKSGRIRCEGCSLVLGLKPYDVDHILEEELIVDKSRPLTIEDGQLLGKDCCHKPKTAERIRMIRKSDRVRDKHTGASKKPSRMPGGRDSNIKIKMDGTVVDRRTGLPIERGRQI